MAPLAQLVSLFGARVTGSDRNLDRGLRLPIFDALEEARVTLVPQDGSGVVPGLDALVHSTAVEPTNPDYMRARGAPRHRDRGHERQIHRHRHGGPHPSR